MIFIFLRFRHIIYKTSQQSPQSLQQKRKSSKYQKNHSSHQSLSIDLVKRLNRMTSKQKSQIKSLVSKEPANQQKNNFLQKSNQSRSKSNKSNEVKSPKGKLSKDENLQNKSDEEINPNQLQENQGEPNQQNEEQLNNKHQAQNHSQQEAQSSQININDQNNQDQNNYQNPNTQSNQEPQDLSTPKNTSQNLNSNFLYSLLHQFKSQLASLQQSPSYNQTSEFLSSENEKKITQLQTKIEILQIKNRLQQKLKNRKQLISFQRINHLQLIFKHYCTHIFKTGKHMTFDRLQYEKVHLTIDRLCVFLKDFNLTTIKMKDNKTREIIEKQQIIKLFKKISPNCRDLDFQQFILILQKLGELYFDSKITYEERKLNERKQRLKIKENLEKKQKYKQQMLKKHQKKIQLLEKGINQTVDEAKEINQAAQDDQSIEKMNNQAIDIPQNNNGSKPSREENRIQAKSKKSASAYSKSFKRQVDSQLQQSKQSDSPLKLTKQQKIEYFYQMISVDDIQSFSNKMRELNLPLFKIYAGKQQLIIRQSDKQRQDQHLLSMQSSKVDVDDEKRLKQLREKLNQRNQKIKHSSVPSLNREEYELRKLKRSRAQEQADGSIKIQRKPKKIDLTVGQINLSSLSKLAYENVNFSKFNPRSFYKKQQDDEIFLKEYGDSPVKTRKPSVNTQLIKTSQNTNRLIDQKQKNSQSFLQKLKQRQSELEISQKKQQISQMYRFNDRTQRQKRLIDKFLEKNKS